MDHPGSSPIHDQRLSSTVSTTSEALEGAAHSQQSLRRLVRWSAQLEFVGVLVVLLCDSKVRPVPLKGKDDGMARARLLHQIMMDRGMRLLLQLLHPERAVLEWRRR